MIGLAFNTLLSFIENPFKNSYLSEELRNKNKGNSLIEQY